MWMFEKVAKMLLWHDSGWPKKLKTECRRQFTLMPAVVSVPLWWECSTCLCWKICVTFQNPTLCGITYLCELWNLRRVLDIWLLSVHDVSTWWHKCWSRSSVMMLTHALCSTSSRCVQRHHAGSGSALAPPRACVMFCRERTSTRDTVETKMWNKSFIFVLLSIRIKYSRGFVKLQLTD